MQINKRKWAHPRLGSFYNSMKFKSKVTKVRIFLAVILLVVLSRVSGAYGEEVKAGGITFSLGFESFPGKHFYVLECVRYQTGSQIDYKYNSREDNMSFSSLSLRVTKMTQIGSKNLFVGMEIGVSFSLSGFEKSWNLPALIPKFSGVVCAPRWIHLSYYYSQSSKEETKACVFPLLGRLSYQRPIQDNLSFNLGLGLGAYLFHSTLTTTETRAYVKDVGNWKKGEVYEDIERNHFTAATPGGEGSAGFAIRLSPHVSLGITGSLILISKVKDINESTSRDPTEWDPASPELVTMKDGNEYGGIGWRIGASLVF